MEVFIFLAMGFHFLVTVHSLYVSGGEFIRSFLHILPKFMFDAMTSKSIKTYTLVHQPLLLQTLPQMPPKGILSRCS
jgi:hypothetical protein